MSARLAPFIVFCGIDGCGKTSAIKAVGEKFPTVDTTREPGGTPLAENIRNLLLSEKGGILSPLEQMHLFFAGRHIHIHERILPKRKSGIPVVSDRFDGSTFAFQRCLSLVAEKIEINQPLYEEFFRLREQVVHHCEPSLYIYLEVDPVIGMRRRAFAREQELNHFDLANIEEQKRRAVSYRTFFKHIRTRGIS